MINHVFQLRAPHQLGIRFDELSLADKVIVRPQYLSICAADQRYYMGMRDMNVLRTKLPMALIHEAMGTVVYDPKGIFPVGRSVMLIPNIPSQFDDVIAENYLLTSRFRASSTDGFMQEFVAMEHDRLVDCEGIPGEVAALGELVSVATHAVTSFASRAHVRRESIGVWGDGSVGYALALLLRHFFPQATLKIFGITQYKLEFFTFADEIINLDSDDALHPVDHAFECVGGGGSEAAIESIIANVRPEGMITLLGVSENKVPLNTRMILEKGLTLLGRSRSGKEDFLTVAKVFGQSVELQQRLLQVISQTVPVRNLKDMTDAFETDIAVPFKTVMRWEV